jgi:hypothetical protein
VSDIRRAVNEEPGDLRLCCKHLPKCCVPCKFTTDTNNVQHFVNNRCHEPVHNTYILLVLYKIHVKHCYTHEQIYTGHYIVAFARQRDKKFVRVLGFERIFIGQSLLQSQVQLFPTYNVL